MAAESSPGSELLALCADLPTITVQVGEAIIVQDDPAPAVFVLVQGAMNIERDGSPFAVIDYSGAVFGEMSTVLKRVATASVRATTESVLHIAHDTEAFLNRPGVALSVLRLTAGRLDAMTRYLADVRHQYQDLPSHLGMVDGVLETLLHHQAPPIRTGSVRDPLG